MAGLMRQTPVPVIKRHGFDTPIKQTERNNFEATRQWTEMKRLFLNDVPKADHKRFFRSYIDSFTGQTAATTLTNVIRNVFPNRCPDRSNAIRVLQKFIDDSVIQDAHEPSNRIFKDDNTLYKVPDAAYKKAEMRIPQRVRRSASLNASLGTASSSSRTDVTTRASSSTRSGSSTRPCTIMATPSRGGAGDTVRLIKHRAIRFDTTTESIAPLATRESDHIEGQDSPPHKCRVRYAEDVEKCDFDKSTTVRELTRMLESVILDQNLTERDRHKKLMRFKQCHPFVFERRFPPGTYRAPAEGSSAFGGTFVMSKLKNWIS